MPRVGLNTYLEGIAECVRGDWSCRGGSEKTRQRKWFRNVVEILAGGDDVSSVLADLLGDLQPILWAEITGATFAGMLNMRSVPDRRGMLCPLEAHGCNRPDLKRAGIVVGDLIWKTRNDPMNVGGRPQLSETSRAQVVDKGDEGSGTVVGIGVLWMRKKRDVCRFTFY